MRYLNKQASFNQFSWLTFIALRYLNYSGRSWIIYLRNDKNTFYSSSITIYFKKQIKKQSLNYNKISVVESIVRFGKWTSSLKNTKWHIINVLLICPYFTVSSFENSSRTRSAIDFSIVPMDSYFVSIISCNELKLNFGTLAVISKTDGKILIAPTKCRNPDKRICLVLATTFFTHMQLGFVPDSHKAIVGSSLTAGCKIEKNFSSTIAKLHLNLFLYF